MKIGNEASTTIAAGIRVAAGTADVIRSTTAPLHQFSLVYSMSGPTQKSQAFASRPARTFRDRHVSPFGSFDLNKLMD